jgi:uncharacterized membrane protein
MDYLHNISFGIGIAGVLVIVYGVVIGLLRFVRTEVHSMRGRKVDADRERLRHSLAYFLLLGLEFLIAADIIDTLMKPSLDELIVLGSMVVIRTIISYSLNSELKSGKKTDPDNFKATQ